MNIYIFTISIATLSVYTYIEGIRMSLQNREYEKMEDSRDDIELPFHSSYGKRRVALGSGGSGGGGGGVPTRVGTPT